MLWSSLDDYFKQQSLMVQHVTELMMLTVDSNKYGTKDDLRFRNNWWKIKHPKNSTTNNKQRYTIPNFIIDFIEWVRILA